MSPRFGYWPPETPYSLWRLDRRAMAADDVYRAFWSAAGEPTQAWSER